MVISLIYLEPLVPAFFLGLVMVVLKSISIFSPLYIFVFLVLLVIVVILYILNLDSSIAVYILHDKGARRDTALNRSWLFLSGQSLSVLSVNAVVYLPLVIAVIAEYLLEGSLFVWYLLPITFILADIASSWCEACTYHIYEVTKNKSRPMQYSKLYADISRLKRCLLRIRYTCFCYLSAYGVENGRIDRFCQFSFVPLCIGIILHGLLSGDSDLKFLYSMQSHEVCVCVAYAISAHIRGMHKLWYSLISMRRGLTESGWVKERR